ncbi:hypothetical protein KR018_008523, partial [Drosophila ironensis]
WDFLTSMGMQLSCAGVRVDIKPRNKREGPAEERLSVAVTCHETGPDMAEFLRRELQAFEKMSGTSHITKHRIKMKDDRPVKQRYFPRNPKMQEEINRQVDELLEKGCIEPSNSPYSAPVIMVMKKTGK